MATDTDLRRLSRRERQIMDILFRRGQASVAEVRAELPDAPSYSAVRALLGILEDKGHVRHQGDGVRYRYRPTLEPAVARRSALDDLLRTFFDGSAEKAVAALLDLRRSDLEPAELDRMAELIARAREEGR